MSAEEKKEVSNVKIGDQKIDFKDKLLRHQIRVLLGLEQLKNTIKYMSNAKNL